jgi:hypothetical protein
MMVLVMAAMIMEELVMVGLLPHLVIENAIEVYMHYLLSTQLPISFWNA